MKSEIDKMLTVWDNLHPKLGKAQPLQIKFEEVLSSVFTAGPFYYYFIHFPDMRISNISSAFKEMHGVEPMQISQIQDILSLMHPDDMEFVIKAEEKAHLFIRQKGVEKFTRYKVSYNFRFKMADGSYHLFNHQSLILSIDEHNSIVKSINIHTDISHITNINNHKWSAIGLLNEPSYLNLSVWNDPDPSDPVNIFSKREVEVIGLIVNGLGTKKISERLFIAEDTVKVHRKNIMKKSGCLNMAELAARSVTEGWI